MKMEIPDDLTVGLEGIAEAQQKSVEQVAAECLRAHFERQTSPEGILRTLRGLKHPSVAAVDEFDVAIAASRLSVSDQSAFDSWQRG